MTLPNAVGPVVVEAPGRFVEWATGVRLVGGMLVWRGGHEHVCQVTGPPVVDGSVLLVPTADHGQLVVRAIGPGDDWRVWPSGMTAWEASQRGLR